MLRKDTDGLVLVPQELRRTAPQSQGAALWEQTWRLVLVPLVEHGGPASGNWTNSPEADYCSRTGFLERSKTLLLPVPLS